MNDKEEIVKLFNKFILYPLSFILTGSGRDGFTLVELLAVIFVFAAIGSIVLSIIVSTLRGNNKTNAINSVESSGDYAIIAMTKAVRNATTLLYPFPCNSVDNPTATSSVMLAFPDGSTSTYSCLDSQGNASVTSNSAALIDTNSVSVTSCSFTCGQDSQSSYPVIGITFSLQSKQTGNLSEQKASTSAVQFQTSVILRNLIR